MIVLGCDHAGYFLKEKIKKYLQKKSFDIVDVGALKLDNADDFSKYVKLMQKAFSFNKNSKIIAFCGSGVGMNIGLNKCKDIRCVLGHNLKEVKLARQHNNVNALSLGGRTTSFFKAKRLVNCFLSTKELDGKYLKRMKDIEIV